LSQSDERPDSYLEPSFFDTIGMAAPAGTPRAIVETLNRELNVAFIDPRMKARIAELGGTPL
jgi:tripartite-type tricarboxylate transporter receptor subunit TctC